MAAYLHLNKYATVAIVVLLVYQFTAFSQLENSSKAPMRFVVGASYTYIWDNEANAGSGTHKYQEHTVNANFAFSFVSRFWIGVQALPIFTRRDIGLLTYRSNYTILGTFLQYDLIKQNNWKIYVESSFNYGDYCTCGKVDPYRVEGLTYLGMGLGAQLPIRFISKHVFLDMGLFSYYILPGIDFKYNYTQYIFGLNYTFGAVD